MNNGIKPPSINTQVASSSALNRRPSSSGSSAPPSPLSVPVLDHAMEPANRTQAIVASTIPPRANSQHTQDLFQDGFPARFSTEQHGVFPNNHKINADAASSHPNGVYLPYQKNGITQTQLHSNDPSQRYFATAPLTGCTVAIAGTQNSPTIAHLNVFPPNNPQASLFEEASVQHSKQQAQARLGEKVTTLTPDQYGRQGNAHVFGVNGPDGWKIYSNTNTGTASGKTEQIFPEPPAKKSDCTIL